MTSITKPPQLQEITRDAYNQVSPEERYIAISNDLPPPGRQHASTDIRISTDESIMAEFKRIRKEDEGIGDFVSQFYNVFKEFGYYQSTPYRIRKELKAALLLQGEEDERRKRFLWSKMALEIGKYHLSPDIPRDAEFPFQKKSELDRFLSALSILVSTQNLRRRFNDSWNYSFHQIVLDLEHGQLKTSEAFARSILTDFAKPEERDYMYQRILDMASIFIKEPILWRPNEISVKAVSKIREYYYDFLPSEFKRIPTIYIKQQKNIERGIDINQTIYSLIGFPYDLSKVKEFTVVNPKGEKITVVSKRVDPLKVRYPEEEIKEAWKLSKLMEESKYLRWSVPEFIGVTYSMGNFYLLMLKEEGLELADLTDSNAIAQFEKQGFSNLDSLECLIEKNLPKECLAAFRDRTRSYREIKSEKYEIGKMMLQAMIPDIISAAMNGFELSKNRLIDKHMDLEPRNVLWRIAKDGAFNYTLLDFERQYSSSSSAR